MTGRFATALDLDPKKMASRMLRAARFDGDVFREVRDDPDATAQSIILVAIIGLCYGVGLGVSSFFNEGTSPIDILSFTIFGLLSALIIALVWSGTTFLVVARLFHASVGYWALSRPLFFSGSPGLLFILMANPILTISDVVRVAIGAWISLASVFAVKHAAGFSTQKSMVTFMVSVLVLVVVQALVLAG